MGPNYRKYLQDALAQRCAKNPNYSMRAFAKQVGISPSHLSRVMNGKKDISPIAALRIANHLKLKPADMENFLDLVGWETSEGHTKELIAGRLEARSKELKRKTLRLEAFRLIADWYHLPLLELAGARGFKSDSRWIAAKLGISVAEAKSAVNLLVSLKLLAQDEKGKLTRVDGASVETPDDITSVAVRKHHEQMSLKAASAVHEQDTHEREFQSLQFPFDEKKIKRLKEMVREFSQKIEKEFKSSQATEIYQMNLQFFRLTRKNRNGGGTNE